LIKSFSKSNIIIEPIVQFISASKYEENILIPTEDSPINDFDASQLFSINRASGFDIYESGTRLNFGLRSEIRYNSGVWADILIGRSLRTDTELQFTKDVGANERFDASGLGSKASDWVLASSVTGRGWYGFARSRFDAENFKSKNGELGLSISQKETSATLRYIYDDVLTNPIVSSGRIVNIYGSKAIYGEYPENYGVYRNLQFYGRHFFHDNWGVSAKLDRDLLTNKFRRSTLSLIYRDDCSWYELVYQRDDTRISNVGGKPRASWQFRLNLATLGSSRAGMRDIR
jgi:LPS-assembly protein